MNDIEKKENIPTTTSLSKLGVTAVGYTVGGVFLLLLQVFSRVPFLGLAMGGLVSLIGIGSLLSKDSADKKAGIIITAAGALTLLSKIPFIAPLSSTLLTIGAVGLLALGIWKGIKFFIGLKKRS